MLKICPIISHFLFFCKLNLPPIFISLVFIRVTLWFCQYLSSSGKQEIRNFRAFTKLYGYVKHFHLSDEAS